jgi:gp16 family phage-associated protein
MRSKRVFPGKNSKAFDLRSNLESIKAVRGDFFAQGLTIKKWAEDRGYNPRLVYMILQGNVRCTRGASHKIAVDLGLKTGHKAQPLAKYKPAQPAKMVSERRAA